MDCLCAINHLAGSGPVFAQSDVLGGTYSGTVHAIGGHVCVLDWVGQHPGRGAGLGHHSGHNLPGPVRSADTILLGAPKTDIHNCLFPINRGHLPQAASDHPHLGTHIHRCYFPLRIHTQF